MKIIRETILIITIFLTACTPKSPSSNSSSNVSTDQTPVQVGDTIIITNTADDGPGSLRQVLLDAQAGNTIIFDPMIFPPDNPATIHVSSELPYIQARNLIVDASNAGVILDGSQVPGDWVAGLQIASTDGCSIMGLQVSNFPGPGLSISGNSTHNVIGGDRSLGDGPFGQGNLLSNNLVGVDLTLDGNTLNTITGNLIGTNLEGSKGLGNERNGVSIWEGAYGNIIGPDNIIAYNGEAGINIEPTDKLENTVIQNNIYGNGSGNKMEEQNSDAQTAATIIFHNGTILTIDENFTQVEALAIQGDKILAIGSSAEILSYEGMDTILIDLEGKTMMPGFVDTHSHILNSRSNPATDNLEKAQALALQYGITLLGDMFTTPDLLAEMREFDDSGKLLVRTSLYLVYANACGNLLDNWYQQVPPTSETGEMLRIGGVKVFADGGSCDYPAISFTRPEGGQGNLWFTQDQLNTIVADVDSAGYQIAIHAIGDRGVETALNAIEFALDGRPNTLRHRIEHNTTVRPEMWPRYQEIGVVPTIIGGIWSCNPWYAGPDPLVNQPWNFPYRAILDANPDTHFAWHTDFPWSSLNPLHHLFSLVTPNEIAGDLTECADPSWVGNKTLTLDEALPMMTIEGAYTLFRENEVGSLVPGKYADLIILSENPTSDLNGIRDIEVWMTMVGGHVRWCAPGQTEICP